MRDFIEKVNEVQRCLHAQGLTYKFEDICKMAAAMPAPRFYTDVPTALRQYNLYLKGKSCLHSVTKRKMYADIFARYERLVNTLEASGQHVCKHRTMEKVLEQPAPSFYYDDDSAMKIYYYAMSQKRKKKL